jgi:hypothetical protein
VSAQEGSGLILLDISMNSNRRISWAVSQIGDVLVHVRFQPSKSRPKSKRARPSTVGRLVGEHDANVALGRKLVQCTIDGKDSHGGFMMRR